MGSTLMLNSKVELGCNICDRCCVNRGDIKITPVNAIEISRFMNIPVKEFLEKYTEQVEGEPLERVIIATGKDCRCILNNKENSKCKIHPVKPMQCVTFPLVPIDIEHDIFYVQDSCSCKEKKEMKVIDWLNGKDGIYLKYKKFYMEWIDFVEEMQSKWEHIDKRVQDKIVNMVFYNYDGNIKNIQKSVRRNMKQARALVKK